MISKKGIMYLWTATDSPQTNDSERGITMKKIGAITVGQSPRVDLIPEIQPILGDSVEIIQAGALDGLSKEEIANEMKIFLDEKDIYIDEPMSKHTTFKIGGKADVFVKLRNTDQIENLLNLCFKENIPLQIVGNGSNLLVKDNGIRGIVAKICMESYHFIDDCTVSVEAGMLNAKLARILMENGLTGFEFASGIPGTIGGAVRMNAGAYAREMKDVVVSTRYLDLEQAQELCSKNQSENKNFKIEDCIKEISNEEHCFSYRNSIFSKKKAIILETVFKFEKGIKEEIQKKMEEISIQRREKQPIDKPSAGSTFKRGEDFITAKLIDEAGLKGFNVGGAEVSNKHAGFVVNTGNATAEDVIQLTNIVKEKVYEKFGKKIELEVEILGE